MALLFAGLSDIGRTRKNNQDAIFINSQLKLFIVADGMGGHNGGDIASKLAVDFVPQFVAQNSELPPEEILTRALQYANKQILEVAQKNKKLRGMGTTVVSLFFQKESAYIANVGDSRAYLVSQNKLFQLTRDHSLVQEKVHLGLYTREQAANDPHKNVLVRTVGFDKDLEVDIFKYKVCRNDIFICSSDGLHAKVSDADIMFLTNKFLPDPSQATKQDVAELVKALVNQANANGGNDNISVIVVLAK